MKSASCTTTSLFIVIFSKNSFFICSFKLCNCLATAFVLKSGCKGSQFYNTKQMFLWKMCSKTCCFRFVLQNRGKYGRFHLLYIHAREKDCGRKQGRWRWREKDTKGAFTGKKEKRGKVRRYAWGHEGESRQCVGKHKERRKKWSCPIIYRKTPDFFLKTPFFVNKHLKGIEHPEEYARKYFLAVFHSRDNVCSANSWFHG